MALEMWTLGEELFATRKTLQLKLPNRIDLHIYIVGAGVIKGEMTTLVGLHVTGIVNKA